MTLQSLSWFRKTITIRKPGFILWGGGEGGMMRILVVNATLVIEVVLVIRSDSLLKSHSRGILSQYRQQSPITITIASVITKGNVGML